MKKTDAARAVLEALEGLKRQESDEGAEALAQALEALLTNAEDEAEAETEPAPAKKRGRR